MPNSSPEQLSHLQSSSLDQSVTTYISKTIHEIDTLNSKLKPLKKDQSLIEQEDINPSTLKPFSSPQEKNTILKQNLLEQEELSRLIYSKLLDINKAKRENKSPIEEQVITAISPDKDEKGNEVEISLDFNQEIIKWNDFYTKHKIKDNNGNIFQIPESLQLTPDAIEKAQELIQKYGFNHLMIIPKGITPNNLIQNPNIMDNYPDRNKDNKNYFNSDITNSNILDTPSSDYQIIFLKEKPNADTPSDHTTETHNQTYSQIIEQEKQLDLEGLDITSFLIYHRYYYDNKYQKHPHIWQENQATWLTKTAEKVKTGYSVNAFWDSDFGKFRFYLRSSVSADSSLGSVFSCSLECEERQNIWV